MPIVKTLVLAAALAAMSLAGSATDAFAQGRSDSKPAAAAKKPGKACSDLASSSQAHKDCIQKQAKSEKKEKVAKPAKPVAPTKPGMKATKKS